MTVMPLNLKRLEILQYKPLQGQSQNVTTQIIVQMFHEAYGFNMTPNEILIICLLNMIQDTLFFCKNL